MKKILSLVLVLVLVLGSMPVFADETVDYGAWLQDAGLLKGDGDGNLLENETLTRAQMMVVLARLYGVEETAMNYSLAPIFTDVEADSYYAPFISYAYMQGWTNGVSATEFDPQGIVTAEQAATLLLRVLGYGDDFVYGEGLTMAASMGIATTFGSNSEILRSELFELMYETVMTAPKGSDQVLGVQLGVVPPTPVAVEVVETKSNYSLKEFDVKFNVAIDEDTLADAVADDADVVSARLAADGMTVIVSVANTTQDKAYTISFKDLASVDGLKFTGDVKVVVSDRVNPTVVGAEMTSSKTMEITFSEAMNITPASKVWDNILVDGGKAVGSIASTSNARVWTFTFNEKQTVGRHDVEITDFNDFVPFANVDFAGSVTVVDDSTAPFVVSVEYVTETSVKVTFNEPVTSGTLVLNGTTDSFTQAAAKTRTMTLSTALDASSTYGENLTYSALTDVEGNVSGDDVVFEWAAPVDQTAPTVTFKLESSNKITLEFNEAVAFTTANLTLLDKDGDDTGFVPTITNTNNKYTVTYSQLTTGNAANYTLEIKNVTDKSIIVNQMAKKSFAFTTTDKKAPTADAIARLIDTEVIRITFDEAMDAAALTDLSNYVFSGALLSDDADAKAVVSADAKAVDLTITGVTSASTISLLKVTDVAGNIVTNFNTALDVDPAASFTDSVLMAKATGLKTVELISSVNKFMLASANDFVVLEDGSTSDQYYVTSAVVAEDGTKVTLTLNTALRSDAQSVQTTPAAISVELAASASVKDTYNTKLTIGTPVVAMDYIAPTVTVATGANAGEVKLTFSETVDATGIVNDIIIRDADGKIVTTATTPVGGGAITTYTISGLTTDKTYSIQVLSRNVVDGNGNVLVEFNGTAKAK